MQLLLLLFLFGCSETAEPDHHTIYESFEQPIAEIEEVYTLGLYDGQEFEHERTFEMSGNTFQKDLVLGNKTSRTGAFVLVVFDHGTQLEFQIDDQTIKNLRFEIAPDEYKKLDITLLGLEDGFHAITYMLLDNPEKQPRDAASSMDLSNLFSMRVNLFNNMDSIPQERPEAFTDFKKSETRTIHGLVVSGGKEKYEVAFAQTAEEIKAAPLTLHYGNANSNAMDFYLVSMLDFEQTPLEGAPYIYDRLGADEEKALSYSLPSGSLAGENGSLQFIMITEPFKAFTNEDPFLLQDPLASNRTAILKK